jgi:hypothetical protein
LHASETRASGGSARNYADLDPLIEITRESKQLITY